MEHVPRWRDELTTPGDTPLDWQALYLWYLDAADLVQGLDECCVIVRAMVHDDAATNLRAVATLNVLTLNAEVWLATHPCPEPWNGRWLGDAVAGFVTIGRLFVRSEGRPDDRGLGYLKEIVEGACDIVRQVSDLRGKLQAIQES